MAGSSATWTPVHVARAIIDSSIVTETVPIRSRVDAAFLLLGLRKAGTPLLIASTPVRAAAPELKARSRRKAIARVPSCSIPGSGARVKPELSAEGRVPAVRRTMPTRAIDRTANMKR